MMRVVILLLFAIQFSACSENRLEFPQTRGLYSSQAYETQKGKREVKHLRFFEDGRVRELRSPPDADLEQVMFSMGDKAFFDLPEGQLQSKEDKHYFSLDFRGNFVHYELMKHKEKQILLRFKADKAETRYEQWFTYQKVKEAKGVNP